MRNLDTDWHEFTTGDAEILRRSAWVRACVRHPSPGWVREMLSCWLPRRSRVYNTANPLEYVEQLSMSKATALRKGALILDLLKYSNQGASGCDRSHGTSQATFSSHKAYPGAAS